MVALLAASCGDVDGVGSDDRAAAIAGDWVLQDAQDARGTVPLPPEAEVTLRAEPDAWGGTAACNTYDGQVEVADDGSVAIVQGFAVTEMGCEPEILMEIERRYLDALLRVTEASVSEPGTDPGQDRRLTLTGPEEMLVFAPQDDND
ncbi:MAG: META domain-containing protein [Nitriliruptoraceae bacterium]|nr:META domain-containing protein [Nitriliruptoraceae bacterium]